MKVFELIAILSKQPAGAEVELQGPGLLSSSISNVDTVDETGIDLVQLNVNDPQFEEDAG
ncbi:hypothetical protein ABIB99_008464 [Bradyrhizobium sp. LA6.1]|uniref:hypothetical protein n=1 Tax=Bradyrhizobium sp. LA6.1 TaxID=3156378 RepID=UPI0033942F91